MAVLLYITACYHVYIPVSVNSVFGLLQSVSSGSSAVHNIVLSCILVRAKILPSTLKDIALW